MRSSHSSQHYDCTELLEIEKGKRPKRRRHDTDFVSTHLRMKKNVFA